MNPSPNHITKLNPDQVFVFGSNEAGRHGRGAALQAVKFGARRGRGVGHYGQTYGIPTKGTEMEVLRRKDIDCYVADFLLYAHKNPDLEFLVTEVGCGLAGYDPSDIAPMFSGAMSMKNVRLPQRFIDILKIIMP